MRAGVACGEQYFVARFSIVSGKHLDQRQPVRDRKRCLERLRQALREIGLYDDPINNNLNGVFALFVDSGGRIQIINIAINSSPNETLAQEAFEQLLVFSFTVLYDRRQQ